ncbi:MAG: PKD domain-containing protein, partial [Thermoplasmata archaeon]|nr:PKD domain-containing protein [Thermoplasmata archaeon]
LVVNANLTQPLTLRVSGVLPAAGAADIYRWDPGFSMPTATIGAPISTSYTVPAQGMLLVRMPNVVSGPPPLGAQAHRAPAQGAPPLSVRFSGNGSGGTAPYQYQWVFGDGTTSRSRTPLHSYATAGQFSATLTVTGQFGNIAQATITTDVARPLTVVLHTNVTNGSVPFCASFRAVITGGIGPFTTHWNFSVGGRSARGVTTTHCFKSVGKFPVVATVVDSTGDSQSAYLFIGAKTSGGPAGSPIGPGVGTSAFGMGALSPNGSAPFVNSEAIFSGPSTSSPAGTHFAPAPSARFPGRPGR